MSFAKINKYISPCFLFKREHNINRLMHVSFSLIIDLGNHSLSAYRDLSFWNISQWHSNLLHKCTIVNSDVVRLTTRDFLKGSSMRTLVLLKDNFVKIHTSTK